MIRQLLLLLCFVSNAAQVIAVTPNLTGNVERPLRYTPEQDDFVIHGGREFFNRPLYGGNTAFRVDAGDLPEFVLYLPGRGGNLRLGVRTPEGAKWLHEADRVESRYRPGEMLYRVGDALLGESGVLALHAIALDDREGLALEVEGHGLPPQMELLWAYGGVNGQRGRRDGDIGTENVPISQYFQLRPEFCRDNKFVLSKSGFLLESRAANIRAIVPSGGDVKLADAAEWGNAKRLWDSNAGEQPVVTGRVAFVNEKPLLLAVERDSETPLRSSELAEHFAAAGRHFESLRQQIVVDTPDAYLNAAVGALCVGADAVWDESQGAVMHGAIAWRRKLLGWRGPYAMDALGWHERARRHLAYWAGQQVTTPIPDRLPPPDENANLARSERALHSNGALSKSHYDMNLVYIDALFRHLRWTGDLEFAREVWPVIERHLAWERRLFRRKFGPEELPLYEGYASFWASDDVQYHGGGAAYASAYNYWHNLQAAKLAMLLGKYPKEYARDAERISNAMNRILWLEDEGIFAEFKDLLGEQLTHPSIGLWSFYHLLDSEVVRPEQAERMTRYVDRELPHLPVRGPGVPDDDRYFVLASSNWMPYTWSVNNVVMGEVMHTALGYWQAGRPAEAYRMFKGALLASMNMGICPGNVGSMDFLDVYRRESQRDFADGAGVMSRAVVEGLFGLRPNLLAGEVTLAPGLPRAWIHATLTHPDATLAVSHSGGTERWTIDSRFPHAPRWNVRLPRRCETASVTVDGVVVESEIVGRSLCFGLPEGEHFEVDIEWSGEEVPPDAPTELWDAAEVAAAADVPVGLGAEAPIAAGGEFSPVDLSPYFNDRVTQVFRNEYRSPRSPFVSTALPKQGIGGWAGSVNETAEIDDAGLRRLGGTLQLPHGVPLATPSEGNNVLFVSQWDNYPVEATVPLSGRGRRLVLLVAGSTNHMQSRLTNGEVAATYVDGASAVLPLVNPTTWWPIEEDYFIDDYQFHRPEPIPPRVDLKTGRVRLLEIEKFKGRGGHVDGGAATVLELPLDPAKELKSLTVRAVANEVVIGLMSATIERGGGQ